MNLALLQEAMAPLPMLPTEVIEKVVDQASDDPESLRNLSLLCKELLTRARFHLFTGIVIRNVEEMESSHEFLNSHPWVPPLVQKVTLSVDIPYDYPKRHIPLLDTIRLHLFSRLPNLHTWCMNTLIPTSKREDVVHVQLSFHPSTLLCYRIHGHHIHALELTGIRFPDISHFIRFVSAFTSLRSLTCSDILVRKEVETPLLDSEIIRKLSKPLKAEHLSVDTSVDVRLVEYLLRASVATLNSLALAITKMPIVDKVGLHKDLETYFQRLEECIGQLSMLSSITLLLLVDEYPWFTHNDSASVEHHIKWTTEILEHFRGRKHLRTVRVKFKLLDIVTLGGPFSRGGSSLAPCAALEELLLTFPASNIQFQCQQHQARRAEFWSPVIRSAFPKLDEQGCLTFPKTPTASSVGHEYQVTSLVTSPNSKWFTTGSADGTIIIWNAEGGAVMHEWLAHWGPVNALSFSPDSRQLVSAGGKGGETVVIWDLSDSVCKLAVLDKNTVTYTSPTSCSWSPDGTLVASAYEGGPVRFWDALTFQQRISLQVDSDLSSDEYPGRQRYSSLHWSSDSCYLVWPYIANQEDGLDYHGWAIWHSQTLAEPPKMFPSHPTRLLDFTIRKISFDPESRHIATALASKRTPLAGVGGALEGASGVTETSNGHSGCVLIWDIESGTNLAALEHDATRVEDISFSPDGRFLLSLDDYDVLKIWDTDSWQVTASLERDRGVSRRACFSPDGKYVARVSNEVKIDIYAIQLWRIGETLCTAVFTEHKGRITDLAFSPNGEFLASGDMNGIVHIRLLSDFAEHWPRSTHPIHQI